MRLHGKLERSLVNGPGERAVVWFQGCTLGCPGCWNPDTHDSFGGEDVNALDLAKWIAGIDGIEGVTFSGGEPMEQAEVLWQIMRIVNPIRPQLSFGMYTGYTQKELEAGKFAGLTTSNFTKPQVWSVFVKPMLDWAKFGRYNQLQPENTPLVTSKNQELVLFTDRYKLEDFPEQAVEAHIDDNGFVQLTGFPVGVQFS
jgi:anaerobic ribonucleoside-triphosphate reductase activating protein